MKQKTIKKVKIMKNLTKKLSYAIYIVLAFVLFQSCNNYPTEVHETINRTKHINIETEVVVKHIPNNNEFRVVTIDGCEYIVFKDHGKQGYSGWGTGGITHKQNCKYCNKR